MAQLHGTGSCSEVMYDDS